MKPFTDLEAGRQLMAHGVLITLTRRSAQGEIEIFILDRKEFEPEELQDEPVIRR